MINKKVAVLVFCMILLVIPLVSADFDIDNYKNFIEEGEYGKIEIWDTAQFFLLQQEDRKLVEYELTRNTESCIGWGCEAEGTVKFYQEGKLFNDLKFKNRENEEKDILFNVYVWVEESYEEEVIDYKQVCEVTEVLGNGTEVKECIGVEDGSHFVTRDISRWIEYDGVNLKEGTYRWKINGKLPEGEDLDWILTTGFGQELTEWAWWSSDYDYCYSLNIEGGNEVLDSFPVYIRLNSTVTDYINTATWGNFRFVDADCNGGGSSMPYEIDNSNSSEAGFWVKSTQLQTGTNTWSIYVDSSDTVTLNEEPEKVWSNNFTGVWHFSNNYLDSLGRMNGSNLGTSAPTYQGLGCAFGGCYQYDGSDDDVEFLTNTVQETTPQFLEVWSNGTAGADEMIACIPAVDGGWSSPWTDACLYENNAGINFDFNIDNTKSDSPAISYTQSSDMRYYAGGYDGDKSYMINYTGGMFKTEESDGSITYHNTKMVTGSRTAQGGYFDGNIDEVRLSKVVRSSGWFNRTIDNLDLTLFGFGEEEENIEVFALQSYPADNFITIDNTVNIGCNFTGIVGDEINDVTVLVYDGLDNLDYTNTESGIELTANNLSYNKTWTSSALTDDLYLWACFADGVVSQSYVGNRTLTINTTPAIQFEDPTFITNYNLTTHRFMANVSLTETYFQNVTFNLWNSSSNLISSDTFLDSTRAFNYTVTYDDIYNYSVRTSTTTGRSNITEVRIINIDTTPAIQFEDPTFVNFYNSTVSRFMANVSLTETYFQNVTFNLWNSSSNLISSDTFLDSTRAFNYTTTYDDRYNYSVRTSTTTGRSNITETRTINIDVNSPSITINLPESSIDYHYLNLNLTLNWTVFDINLESCWYDYNTTTINVTCSDNTSEIKVVEYLNRNFTFYANDTFGNTRSLLYNWTYNVWENSRNFSNLTYETSTQVYQVNVTSNSSLTSTSLMYDGTAYSTTQSGDTYTGTITHITNGTNIFSFNFTYGGDFISSYSSNQTVNRTEFNICNVSDFHLNTTFLNLTFLDEETLLRMGSQIDTSTINYWIGDGSVTEQLIYSNLTNASEYNFCFTPASEIMENDITIQYSATGYPQRKYDTTSDLTNTTTHKTLYLLSSTDGIYSTIQVVDENGDVVSGVEVTMERQFAGDWTIVGKETTDGAGAVTFWVNPDYNHRFTLEKDGCGTTNEIIRPTQTTYTSTINCFGARDEIYVSSIEGIKYFLLPGSGILEIGQQNFSFQVASSKENLVNVRMEIVNTSGYILTSQSSSCAAAGCTISTLYNVTSVDNIKGRYYVDLGSGYILLEADAHWIEVNITRRDGTFTQFWLNLRGVFDEWHEEGEDTTNTSDFNRIVFIFLLLAIGISTFNKLTGFDTSNGGAFLIFLTVVVLMGSIAGHPDNGFFYLDNLTMTPFINNYLIAGIMVVIFISHYIGVALFVQKRR